MVCDNLPYHAQWDITQACNFRCTFCLTSSGKRMPGELDTDQARALIDKLYDEGIWFLKIMGGEPFARPDALPLMKHAAGKGMILSFSTNASRIDEQKAAGLEDIRKSIIYVQMSLYGENASTYEKVTGSARNFESAVRGLDRMVKHGLEVTVLTVATHDNVGRLQEFYNVARDHGAREFRLTPEVRLGRSANKPGREQAAQSAFWPRYLASIAAIRREKRASDPEVVADGRPLFAAFLNHQIGVPCFYENCTAGTTMLYIDPAGRALPCPFLKHLPDELHARYSHLVATNITTHTFNEVWDSEAFKALRSYYDPKHNLFHIEENCRFFKNGSCIPCALTPCGCSDLIRNAKQEISSASRATSRSGPRPKRVATRELGGAA